jgi:MFS family permease
MNAAAWRLTLAATALMALVTGSRSAFGLFVSPLNSATGVGLAGISLAAAMSQLALGLGQPLAGRLAERFGAARVIGAGAWLLAATTAATAWADSTGTLALALCAAALAGAAVGSYALLVGEIGRRLPLAQQSLAVGLVGAGGSAGQLLLSPATQWGIGHWGWVAALWVTAALALLAWPLARAFAAPVPAAAAAAAPGAAGLAAVLRQAAFWRIALAFGVCGFHVGFLGMHMPGVIERCGLPASLAGVWLAVLGAANIAGSLGIGWALRRHDAGLLLTALFLLRAACVSALLVLPPTAGVMLGFAVVMGLSWMAVLPPISQLLSQHFGTQRLGTLLGLVMLLHQAGSFAGIGLGGWIVARNGSDLWTWRIDIALALLAVVLVLPLARNGRQRHAGGFGLAGA